MGEGGGGGARGCLLLSLAAKPQLSTSCLCGVPAPPVVQVARASCAWGSHRALMFRTCCSSTATTVWPGGPPSCALTRTPTPGTPWVRASGGLGRLGPSAWLIAQHRIPSTTPPLPAGPSGFTPGSADYPSLAFDGQGTPFVAFSDGIAGGGASLLRFDAEAGAWAYMGEAGFSDGERGRKVSCAPFSGAACWPR